MTSKVRTTGQQNIITHVGILGDATPSVGSIKPQVVETINNLVKLVAEDSKERNQEVRVTLYTFNSWQDPMCKYYDMDALRVPVISVDDYPLDNMTALREATAFVIDEMQEHTWQKYGDHSFLLYVVTDGMDNQSEITTPARLREKLTGLPGNWTVGVQVPDAAGAKKALQCGFADGNIDIWETSVQGAVRAGERLAQSYKAYSAGRSAGVRSTSTLFRMADVSATELMKGLTPVTTGSYAMESVTENTRADAFFPKGITKYVRGKTYYQLHKSEKIQATKELVVLYKDVLYSGPEIRKRLGIPDYDIQVNPRAAAYRDYTIFVQSTADNRYIRAGTAGIVFR